jgi:hypothetical protein
VPILPLDSAAWNQLQQAYGSAEDVPRLLEHLEALSGRQLDELWLGLWATLWRDGHVFSASYAALPHLVAYAARQPAAERARALHLATSIELARLTDAGPTLPNELASAYQDAIATIPAIVAECVGESWSPDATQILSAALAMAKGNAAFAAAVLEWQTTSG